MKMSGQLLYDLKSAVDAVAALHHGIAEKYKVSQELVANEVKVSLTLREMTDAERLALEE